MFKQNLGKMTFNEAFGKILGLFEQPEPESHVDLMIQCLQAIKSGIDLVEDEGLRKTIEAYLEEWSSPDAILSDPEVFQERTSELTLDLGNAGFLSGG